MASIEIESARKDYPGGSDQEIAKALAAKHDYMAVVRYKNSPGISEFTNFGLCKTEAEIRGYMSSPYCHAAEVIYDGRSSLFPLNASHVLNGHCELCSKHATRESLQLGAGNDFYFCPKCGLLFCETCYVRLPLTSSPGYGMCPKCRVQVKRTLPSFFVKEASPVTPEPARQTVQPTPPQTHTVSWYRTESAAKSVRQVVIEIPPGLDMNSKFGMILLGVIYRDLMMNTWGLGFFRLDSDRGPFLMVRGDRVVNELRNCPMKVAFCFYRMKAGGLVAVYAYADCPAVAQRLTDRIVLFEMVYGCDQNDTRQLILDAISRDALHICFAEGDGPGKMSGGAFISSAIRAQYDVVIPLPPECRAALKEELAALLNYHSSLLANLRDFQRSGQQMWAENPQGVDPILPRSSVGGTKDFGIQAGVLGVQLAEKQPPPLSERKRLLDTFIAPTKTFTDLRRSANWWLPFLITAIMSLAFIYVVDQKVGFRKVAENQLRTQPKPAKLIDSLPADQRETAIRTQASITRAFAYGFPVLTLLRSGLVATVLLATLKFALSADVTFKTVFALVIFASLPAALKALLAIVSLLAGVSGDAFSLQNPIATNPGYFVDQATNPALFSFLSTLDLFTLWTLVLTAMGIPCISKVKPGAAYAVVFGWYAVWVLAMVGITAG